MGGNTGANKCKRGTGSGSEEQPWFKKKRQRKRRRNKIAKQSRKANR